MSLEHLLGKHLAQERLIGQAQECCRSLWKGHIYATNAGSKRTTHAILPTKVPDDLERQVIENSFDLFGMSSCNHDDQYAVLQRSTRDAAHHRLTVDLGQLLDAAITPAFTCRQQHDDW